MPNRRIIIGDVHGYYDSLLRILEAVSPGKNDQVYFLGDLIDRGPKSSQVVEFVIKNNYPCLLGNHEQMLLDVVDSGDFSGEIFQAWLYSGGNSTVASYGNKIPAEHIEWMQNLPNYLDLDDIWLVHAGVDPNMTIEEQTSEQFCWIREEFHSMNQPYFDDKLIITGHTITFTMPGVNPGKLAQGEGWLCIDTGVYHRSSGWLSAVDITNKKVYQFNTNLNRLRIVPLDQAITKIRPSTIMSRRSKIRSYSA